MFPLCVFALSRPRRQVFSSRYGERLFLLSALVILLGDSLSLSLSLSLSPSLLMHHHQKRERRKQDFWQKHPSQWMIKEDPERNFFFFSPSLGRSFQSSLARHLFRHHLEKGPICRVRPRFGHCKFNSEMLSSHERIRGASERAKYIVASLHYSDLVAAASCAYVLIEAR